MQKNCTQTQKKYRHLFDSASEDPYFSLIFENVKSYGFEIISKVYGRGGYVPQILLQKNPEQSDNRNQSFCFQNKKVQITVSKGLIKRSIILSFYHELMHFEQDRLGFYPFPLLQRQGFAKMIDMPSFISVLNFCEAWAETEAIRGVWRLCAGDINHMAWKESYAACVDRVMLDAFVKTLQRGVLENHAAIEALCVWYSSKKRRFYDRQAASLFKEVFQKNCQAAPHDRDTINQNLLRIDLKSFLEYRMKAAGDEIPAWLEGVNISDMLFQKIVDESVLSDIKAFEARYPPSRTIENPEALECGSAVYLWDQAR